MSARERAIELLREIKDQCSEGLRVSHDCPATYGCASIFNDATEALAALESDGWVKCSERLPENSGYHLCCLLNRKPNPAMLPYYRCHVVWFDRNRERFDTKKSLTHWRELPPPPEETK